MVNDDLYAFGNTATVMARPRATSWLRKPRHRERHGRGRSYPAARAVEVNGTVEDDARIAGQALVLGDNAIIADDLFAAGYSLENRAGSNIGGSLFYGGYQALLAGTIEENFQAGVGALELRGEVGGDINAALGEAEGGAPQFLPGSPVSIPAVEPGLTLTDSARVGGDPAYTSSEEGAISDGAQIAGDVSREDVLRTLPSKSQRPTPSPLPSSITCGACHHAAPGRCARALDTAGLDPEHGGQGQGVAASESRLGSPWLRRGHCHGVRRVARLRSAGGGLRASDFGRSGVLVHRAVGLTSAVLVTAYLISAAYLAPVVVALAGGRLLLRTCQTDRRAGRSWPWPRDFSSTWS